MTNRGYVNVGENWLIREDYRRYAEFEIDGDCLFIEYDELRRLRISNAYGDPGDGEFYCPN